MTEPCTFQKDISDIRVDAAETRTTVKAWMDGTIQFRHELNLKIDAILKKQDETNGKVRSLNEWREQVRGVQWALGVLFAFGAFIIPIIVSIAVTAWAK